MRLNITKTLFTISYLVSLVLIYANSYLVNLKGATVDAERFIEYAQVWAKDTQTQFGFRLDFEAYIQYIGLQIYLLGSNEFFLLVVNITIYYAAISLYCNFLQKRIGRLNKIVLIYLLFSPSIMLRSAALLREPILIASLLVIVSLVTKIILEEKVGIFRKIRDYSLMIIGFSFHKAFIAFVPIFISLQLFFSKNQIRYFIVVILAITTLIAFVPFLSEFRGAAAIVTLLTADAEIAQNIVSAKQDMDARATYNIDADLTSLGGVFDSLITSQLYFYLYPFPNKLVGILDGLVFIENTFRVAIILYGFIFILRSPPSNDRSARIFILLVYLSLNAIWAVGTYNYGTGSRHHWTTVWLLLHLSSFSNYRKHE